mmetsp:Transcript_7306/g.11089  ORF Transcript_7306/g.11089 Transcript_7306/m.11089 type:complete len:778 (+) Transcript_7306:121-2454(+)
MPYPTGQPDQKHDLVCPQTLPREGSLSESQLAFSDTLAIFNALDVAHPPLKQIAVVFTYKDAPQDIKLSKALVVIGFAGVSLKVVRQLTTDDNIPDCLHRCTLAVTRGDGEYASKLERYHVTNTPKFAKFMKRLRREDIVAILAPDKHGRFGILAPSSECDPDENIHTKDDFCATVYVGKVKAVKEYLAGGGVAQQTQQSDDEPTFVPPCDEDTGPVWKPPEDDNDNEPMWKPPQDDDNSTSGNLWQPPSNDNDTGGFGDTSGSDELWKPPSNEDNDGAFDNDLSWKPSSETTAHNTRKRSYNEMDDNNNNKYHADAGAAAADAFYSGLTRTLDTRSASRIFHMRAFNGWVKAIQIQELNPSCKSCEKNGPMRILDLACGKGGDLGKWVRHKRGILNYVGVDVARGSLKDAAIRARKMRNKLSRGCTFTCADLGHDVPGRLRSKKHKNMQKLMSWSLQNEAENESSDPVFSNIRGGGISLDDKFDVISVQFAIHYMMQTRKRARRFFQTSSELLEVGGNLICTTIDARVVLAKLMDQGLNLHFDEYDDAEIPDSAVVEAGDGACQIKFTGDMLKKIFYAMSDTSKSFKNDAEELFGLEYTFTLVEGSDHEAGVGDAVNLPEWLNPIPMLEAVANDAGLELVSAENFHEFYNNRRDPMIFEEAHNSLYKMNVLDRNGTIYPDNWEISGMYCAIKFRKVRESNMNLEEEEDDDVEDDNEPELDADSKTEKVPLDPIKSAKMLPMAMMKAKKKAGAEEWQGLSNEEKKILTRIELENMLS